MNANSFGRLFQIHSFGESHGAGLGVVIDGCPAGVSFDGVLLLRELARRKPGSSDTVSARSEADTPEILSGVFEGKTLGTPIAVLVRNQDAKPADYEKIKTAPRAGHADDVWKNKFGHSDPRGGGRSSGRETLARVIGGAFAQMLITQIHPKLRIHAFVSQLGPQKLNSAADINSEEITGELQKLKAAGDSWGGIVTLSIVGAPAGLGSPVFAKLKSELCAALMSVGAVSAVEFGDVIARVSEKGSQVHRGDSIYYGGIRGGISTGEEIRIHVYFKPTSSILDVAKAGRHDPAVLIRAVPVLESMAALVIADQILAQRLDRV